MSAIEKSKLIQQLEALKGISAVQDAVIDEAIAELERLQLLESTIHDLAYTQGYYCLKYDQNCDTVPIEYLKEALNPKLITPPADKPCAACGGSGEIPERPKNCQCVYCKNGLDDCQITILCPKCKPCECCGGNKRVTMDCKACVDRYSQDKANCNFSLPGCPTMPCPKCGKENKDE